MRERKQAGRFTIQFNMEDPQQRQAAEVLARQGRRKAQFLTSAVMQYTHGAEHTVSGIGSVGIDEATLKRMVRDVLRGDPQLFGIKPDAQGAPQPEPEQSAEEWDSSTADSVFAAMSNTLAAFRQK